MRDRKDINTDKTNTDKTTEAASQSYYHEFLKMRGGDAPQPTASEPASSSQTYSSRYLQRSESAAAPSPSATETVAEPVVAKAEDAGRHVADNDLSNTEEAPAPVKTKPLRKLVPRGVQIPLAKNVKRQIARSERELGMFEGNLSSAGKDLTTLYFTSCFDGDGKTISALYAAWGLANQGERVLLIDTNITKPALQRYFPDSGPGFAEVIAGGVPLEEALHATDHKELEYISAGTLPLGAHITDTAMQDILTALKPYYKYIILDGSSVFSGSEATRMAPVVDGMILVVTCEQTRWEAAQSAEEKISNSGGNLLGISMNRRKFYIPKRIYNWLSN